MPSQIPRIEDSFANASSKLTNLSNENIHTRLAQSDNVHTSSFDAQSSLLTDVKSELEKNKFLLEEARSETKSLSSKLDL